MDTKTNKYYSIVALTLGDGYLQYSHNNIKGKAYIDIAHKAECKDFIEYKAHILSANGFENHIALKTKQNGNHQYRVSSKYYQLIGDVKRRMYPNNQKTFNKNWIKHLDAWALAIFWMDDGCLCRQHKKRADDSIYEYQFGIIATQSFDYQSQCAIIEWLKAFNIEATINHSKNKYRIRMNRDNLKKLIEIVAPYVKNVPSMVYKITI